jgi:hypothetical protein
MAATSTIYNPFRKHIADGTIDLNTDTLKLALVSSTYTPSTEHSVWADITGGGHEVATGAGYTTGGVALASVTLNRTAGVVTLDAANPSWTALTKTFRYGVLYAEVTRNAVVNPLILYMLFDATPANVVVAGVNWTVTLAATGILTHS